MRRALVALVVATSLAACGGGGSSKPAATATPVDVRGVLTLEVGDHPFTAPNYATSDPVTCAGTGGYDDIVEGAGVTVYDAKGTIIGSGALQEGTYKGPTRADGCDFEFAIRNVPASSFYQVEVSHRGKVTEQPSQVDDVSLTLGR